MSSSMRSSAVVFLALRLFGGCDRGGTLEDSSRPPCAQHAEPNARFRTVVDGCRFGYIVDSTSGGKYVEGAWTPSDDHIAEVEKLLQDKALGVNRHHGRQYLGLNDTVLRVTIFCNGDVFPFHSEISAIADGFPCVRRAEYDFSEKVLRPDWYVHDR